MPVHYFQHFRYDCSNHGVNLGITEHWNRLHEAIKAGWVKTILDWDHTRSLNFDGEFHEGRGDTWVRTGSMENIVVTPTGDVRQQDRWTGKRTRDISYTVAYDIRIETLPVEGKDEGSQHTFQVKPFMLHTSG